MLGLFGEVFGDRETYVAGQLDDAYLQHLLASAGFVAVVAFSGTAVIGGLARQADHGDDTAIAFYTKLGRREGCAAFRHRPVLMEVAFAPYLNGFFLAVLAPWQLNFQPLTDSAGMWQN
jgi:hypothetical protein